MEITLNNKYIITRKNENGQIKKEAPNPKSLSKTNVIV